MERERILRLSGSFRFAAIAGLTTPAQGSGLSVLIEQTPASRTVEYPVVSRISTGPKAMPIRAALALLLLLPAVAAAQGIDRVVSAVVRISGERGDTPVRGSGFVVGLDRDKATIVTASHVIEGASQLAVTFAADPSESFPAGSVLGMEAGSRHGLAVFQVRGVLPAGVTALSFDIENRPALGAPLFLLGFPQRALTPRTAQRVLSAPSGTLLLIDQDIGEGFSGGPVVFDGKVVGVITDTDEQATYAVNAVVAREAIVGWGVKLGAGGSEAANATTQGSQAPPVGRSCAPAEKRTKAGIDFLRICSGTFRMGSEDNDEDASEHEKPAHQVTLSEFWIGKTEITNEQFRHFHSDHRGEARLPAVGIGWSEAQAACKQFGGRLPTEAEWEYAARAGRQSAWPFGDEEVLLGDYAWYHENSDSVPHTVGMTKPNGWGLHDMHGNAREWVADWYGDYPRTPQKDPTGPRTGDFRVLRGGSFAFTPKALRSADRFWVEPTFQDGSTGFRCVLPSGREP